MKLLAQADLATVPAEFLKWLLLCGVVALLVTGVVVGIYAALRKTKVEIEPQPVEVSKAPKRFNYALAEERHAELDRRVTALEAWRDALVDKLDEDKTEIIRAGETRMTAINEHIEGVRNELNRYARDTERTLGRIESRLPSKET